MDYLLYSGDFQNVGSHLIQVQNIPRLNTAIAEWVAVILFLGLLTFRFNKRKTLLLAILGLAVQIVFLIGTNNVPILFWVPCMFGAYALMVGELYLLCDISVSEAWYLGTQAFIIAEFAASLEWQLTLFFADIYAVYMVWLWILILLVVYSIVFLILRHAIQKHLPKNHRMEFTSQELASEILIGVFVFASSNLGFWEFRNPFSTGEILSMFNLRTFVDFGGMAVLFAHLLVCGEARMRQEIDKMHDILENQYQQYKVSRDSIELVNIKYHDLKHQIAVLKSEEDPEKRRVFLEQMERDIKQYELQNKTGNKVLDTILTGKSIYCEKHGITLTCVADGTLLDFIDIMDICSIFGNALDNAIECEIKIPEKERRLIHLTVSRQKDFLLIRVENYMEEPLKMENGVLVSTKEDKENHGYGIKSIRFAAEKYGGAVSVSTKDNWFDMKILIPINLEKSKEDETREKQ